MKSFARSTDSRSDTSPSRPITNTKFDIIIIGTGIAGLYSAYKIQKQFPDVSVLLLERNPKNEIGGRAGNVTFQNTTVVTGAGIGRKEKDKLLMNLLKELDIPFGEFQTGPHYSETIQPICNLKKTFLFLKKEYRRIEDGDKTFQEYATTLLEKDEYKHFITCSGYTDYEKEDAYEVLYNYGFNDNYDEWTGISIPWKKLVDELRKHSNICASTNVKKIQYVENEGYKIHVENGDIFKCKKVIVATTVGSVLKIVPGASSANSIYRKIHGQPFIRVYGKFSKKCMPIVEKHIPTSIVVPGPIHRIIPMDPAKGVYMIAYTDNRGAITVNKYAKNKEHLCRLLEISLGIEKNSLQLDAIIDFYWEEGTHYYDPLPIQYKTRKEFIKIAQNPMNNMLVVGEMISLNQGWVEGALESVDAVVTKKWIST